MFALAFVVNEGVGVVADTAAGPEQAVKQVHIYTAEARRTGAKSLIAAADGKEPITTEGEVVAAADEPGEGFALKFGRLLGEAGGDRVDFVAFRRKGKDTAGDAGQSWVSGKQVGDG